MATMQDIEKQTREFAAAKRQLDDIIAEIKAETEPLKKKYLPRIRAVMNQVTARHGDLYREIVENPGLFTKPRTQVFDGVRVGFSRGKGALQIEDPELTIKLIKKLDETQQKKIGVSIEGKEDRVVIEETDTQINKILSSLLKFQVEELSAEYQEEAA